MLEQQDGTGRGVYDSGRKRVFLRLEEACSFLDKRFDTLLEIAFPPGQIQLLLFELFGGRFRERIWRLPGVTGYEISLRPL